MPFDNVCNEKFYVKILKKKSVDMRWFVHVELEILSDDSQKSKKKEELPIYEQAENIDNPLRCPVKLYEFYLSKW